MDIDHAAILLPIVLGLLGAVVTIYPPSGTHRHAWAAVLFLGSVMASAVGWVAVDSSQQSQRDLMTAVTGGDNYCYVYPLEPAADAPFSAAPLQLRMGRSTVMYDVRGTIYESLLDYVQPTGAHVGHLVPLEVFQYPVLQDWEILRSKLGVGEYQVHIFSRNGSVMEMIKVFDGPKSLEKEITAWYVPQGQSQGITILQEPPLTPHKRAAEVWDQVIAPP